MKYLLIALVVISLLGCLLGCNKDKMGTGWTVTTSYSNDCLYGTVNSKDSLVRGFYIGKWDGNQVVIDNTTDVYAEYGVGDFGMKPTFKAGTTYYVWAYAYRRGQEGLAGIGNTLKIEK